MLLTRKLERRFAEVGRQRSKDPIVIAKFFYPLGSATWYATEYDPSEKTFFGYASLFGDWNDEWGYFSLEELQTFKGSLGLGIERDMYWEEKRASEVLGKEKVPWL